MLQIISDLSKDARGYRVRLDYAAMSDDELQSTWDGFCEELDESIASESRSKLQAQKTWEQDLVRYMEIGAKSWADAIRWDMDAYNARHCGELDVGFYCYLRDIDYALERRIKEALEA
jgi:hypothetical protein